jgi:hypothetical protein
MNSRDILFLEANTLGGNDYIIADLHGQVDVLRAQLEKMTPNDRLVCAGDYTDRGPDSKGVIETILAYQKNHPNRLFVIWGNHELLAWDTLNALPTFSDELMNIPYSENGDELEIWCQNFKKKYWGKEIDVQHAEAHRNALDIIFHLQLGGFWLLDLFHHDLHNKNIKITKEEVTLQPGSFLSRYANFLTKLPHAISVSGQHPYIVVHADLPFSDQMLVSMREQPRKLLNEEINYIQNARFRPSNPTPEMINSTIFILSPHPRSAESVMIYAGHSVTIHGHTPIIRLETNTLNLDVGSYLTGIGLVVNHTETHCKLVNINETNAKNLETLVTLDNMATTFTAHIQKNAARHQAFFNKERGTLNENLNHKRVNSLPASFGMYATELKKAKSDEEFNISEDNDMVASTEPVTASPKLNK